MCDEVLISIIVPIYNVQQYLEECLNSIISQQFEAYEVLLIDDGSTDNSASICKKYTSQDYRFKYYYKQNGGLSDARNFGMERANGKYIMFVDSDDYIEKHALNRIAEKIDNYQLDIITICMLRVLPDGEFIVNDSMLERNEKELDTYTKQIQWLVEKSENSWSAVRYIIKRSLVQMHNLSFQKGILHEDLDWSAKIFMLAKNMGFIVEPLYYYRIGRTGSITTVIKAKRITDILDTVKRFCLRENSNSELSLLIHRELVNSAFRSMQDYPYVKKEEKQNVKAAFAKNREYLNGSNKKSVKILLKISDIFGIDVAFLLVNVAAKIRRRRG